MVSSESPRSNCQNMRVGGAGVGGIGVLMERAINHGKMVYPAAKAAGVAANINIRNIWHGGMPAQKQNRPEGEWRVG